MPTSLLAMLHLCRLIVNVGFVIAVCLLFYFGVTAAIEAGWITVIFEPTQQPHEIAPCAGE